MRVGPAAVFALALSALPAAAQTDPDQPVSRTPQAEAQEPAPPPPQTTTGPQLIEPANALEHTFLAALNNPEMRPVFRRMLLESQVALALEAAEGEALRSVPIQGGRQAAAIFTSPARLRAILGAEAPFEAMTGRAALARARENNVAINFMWVPMLTLEPADIEQWLEAPDLTQAPRGPSQ